MKELIQTFLKLGFLGFGGPIAAIAMMEREILHKKKWISKDLFHKAYTLCKILPGPASSQMAIFLGYQRHGVLGGLLSGLLFILPGCLIILVLAYIYFEHQSFISFDLLFYGMSPVVIAIILDSVIRMGRPYAFKIKFNMLMIFSILWMLRWSPYELALILLCGLISIGWEWRANQMGKLYSLAPLILFFLLCLKAGTLLFGGGLAIIPLLNEHIVEVHQWMSQKEFLDGLTMGLFTPGPVMKSVVFFGYKISGIWGAFLGFLGVFIPSFIFIFAAVPFLNKIQSLNSLKYFVEGAMAAIIGGIAVVIFSLAHTSLQDPFTWVIAIGAFVLLISRNVPSFILIFAGSLLGILYQTILN